MHPTLKVKAPIYHFCILGFRESVCAECLMKAAGGGLVTAFGSGGGGFGGGVVVLWWWPWQD